MNFEEFLAEAKITDTKPIEVHNALLKHYEQMKQDKQDVGVTVFKHGSAGGKKKFSAHVKTVKAAGSMAAKMTEHGLHDVTVEKKEGYVKVHGHYKPE